MQASAAVARYTLLEAWRSGFFRIYAGMLVLAWMAAEFAASLALTASASYRSVTYAALVRLLLAGLVMLFVVQGVAREHAERLLELYWSRPLSRGAWFAGRLLGALLLTTGCALLAGLPLLTVAPPLPVLAWSVSFAAELAIVSAAALTAAVALMQLTPALLATAAFYVLARAMSAIVLMSSGPTVDPEAWSTPLVARAVELIALALPALDRYAPSQWLHAPDVGPAEVSRLLLEAGIYVLLIAAVGLIDVRRREA
jgi:Cu-processing system permease protein